MDIRYGQATLADVPELVRLRLSYLQADFGEVDPGVLDAILHELPDYFKEHLGANLHAHVAWCDDVAVGTVWLLVVQKPASVAFVHGLTGSIFNVYVDPTYRKRGIARQLMANIICQAHELGLDRLELRSTAMGYNLYKSIGFEEDESTHTAMNYYLSE